MGKKKATHFERSRRKTQIGGPLRPPICAGYESAWEPRIRLTLQQSLPLWEPHNPGCTESG